MQLDIFEHGRDVMLRHDAIVALLRRDAAAAGAACDRLAEAFPQDASLADLRALAGILAPAAVDPLEDHEALRRACRRLDEVSAPAARRALGDADGRRWRLPFWQDLARHCAQLPFKAACEVQHAAPLWLRARDWEAAAQAVATIPSWRRIPLPLRWMAEAQLHLRGLQSTWPLLVELGWLSPSLLAGVAAASPDPTLPRWVERFERQFEFAGDEADLAWLPAWLLTEQPSLVAHLAAAQPSRDEPPEQAMRLLVELLGLERQGRHHDIVPRRKALRDLCPELYAAYIRTR